MNKPSEMPSRLVAVDAAVTELERARAEAKRDFLDRYGDTVEAVSYTHLTLPTICSV